MTILNSNQLKIACFSDIHLGNKRNKTSDIIHGLRKAINENPEASTWNILFLAGDVFDTLLELNSDDVREIKIWVSDLIKFCHRYSITLRILEGTPSHDWTQSTTFMTTASILDIQNLDIKYIDKIEIEYIEKYNIHVLYIPDEINPTTEETYEKVQQLMMSHGLTKVDYAVMHGQFDYQLPKHITGMPRHDSQKYLDIVKHYIFIGHIHTYSMNDRIVAQGSFDRLTHGQEEPKGYVVATVDDAEKHVFFIENKFARKYLTIPCYGFELNQTLELLKKKCAKLPDNSCVRIEAESKNPVFANMSEVMKLYPLITWTKLAKDKEEKKAIIVEEKIDYIPITITKDNIFEMLMGRVKQHIDRDDHFTRANEIMKGVI